MGLQMRHKGKKKKTAYYTFFLFPMNQKKKKSFFLIRPSTISIHLFSLYYNIINIKTDFSLPSFFLFFSSFFLSFFLPFFKLFLYFKPEKPKTRPVTLYLFYNIKGSFRFEFSSFQNFYCSPKEKKRKKIKKYSIK